MEENIPHGALNSSTLMRAAVMSHECPTCTASVGERCVTVSRPNGIMPADTATLVNDRNEQFHIDRILLGQQSRREQIRDAVPDTGSSGPEGKTDGPVDVEVECLPEEIRSILHESCSACGAAAFKYCHRRRDVPSSVTTLTGAVHRTRYDLSIAAAELKASKRKRSKKERLQDARLALHSLNENSVDFHSFVAALAKWLVKNKLDGKFLEDFE